jgi:hypothetical protein
LAGKNPWVWAGGRLWLASFRGFGLLKTLAEAAGTTTVSIRDAAKEAEGMNTCERSATRLWANTWLW